MKRRRAAQLLLAILLLTGCAAEPDVPGKASTPPAQTQQAAAAPAAVQGPEEAYFSAAQTEAQARPMTEDEVLSAYERAETAYAWFTGAALPTGQESITLDGRIYRRVEYPGIENMEGLRTYLRGSFSQEVTDRLLAIGGDQPLYRDIDGALYAAPTGRSSENTRGEVQLRVEQTGETAYVVNVTVDLLDTAGNVVGVECGSIPYELEGGRWVFTDFQLLE